MAKKIPHLSIPSIGNLPIEIKLYGDWHKAIELVDNLGPSIKKGYDTAVNKFSKDLLKIVLFSIATGTPPKEKFGWRKTIGSTQIGARQVHGRCNN